MELSNREILAELDKKIFGHTPTKKMLITCFRRTKLRHQQKIAGKPLEDLLRTHNMLLIGDSGCGKTFIVQTIAKIIRSPLLFLDATELTHTGASGGIKAADIEKRIRDYAEEYKKDEFYPTPNSVINQLIVFVDEFDKLSSNSTNASTGNWNAGTQKTFLKLFENSKSFESITWIFAGAFVGLTDSIEKKSIGFIKNEEIEDRSFVCDEALLRYGFIPEIIGRISLMNKMESLTREDYETILYNFLIPKKIKDLQHFGYEDFSFSNEDKERIIKDTLKSNQGVRALQRGLDSLFLNHEFEYEDTEKYKEEVMKKKQIKVMTDEEYELFTYGMKKYR